MSQLGFWSFAQRDPGALALVDPQGREWTRGELLSAANRIAHGLRALGLGRGDCVAAGIMPAASRPRKEKTRNRFMAAHLFDM